MNVSHVSCEYVSKIATKPLHNQIPRWRYIKSVQRTLTILSIVYEYNIKNEEKKEVK